MEMDELNPAVKIFYQCRTIFNPIFNS